MTKRLAIHGGPPQITIPPPHINWPRVTEDMKRSVAIQMDSSLSIADRSGVIELFEDEFRLYHNRKYAVLCNSGTSALLSAFFSLGLKKGDNVIVPDYTFFATASPLALFPVEIRFCDADASGNLDPDHLSTLVDAATKAVVITHMWGVPCQMDRLTDVCGRHGIRLIEDCSHAHGARFDGRVVGSFGDVAIWSLQGQKLVSGGEGGILVTDDEEIYHKSLLLGHFNKRCRQEIRDSSLSRYAYTGYGLKLRAHPLAICIALDQFRKIEYFIAQRTRFAGDLLALLRNYSFVTLPDLSRRQASWYALTISLENSRCLCSARSFQRALLAEGCREVDIPGSTRNISAYPLFYDPPVDDGILARSPNATASRPGAIRYFERAVKFPVWTFDDEAELHMGYLAAIAKVCNFIQSGGQI